MNTIQWHGHAFALLPEGALFEPATGDLLIADPHLGKPAAFRRAGLPVPADVNDATLERLDAIAQRTGAARLIVLGDLLHARAGRTETVLDAFTNWRCSVDLEIVLVRGNHDHAAGDPPPDWDVTCVDEPWTPASIAMCHHAEAAAGVPCLAGHVHPVVVLRDTDGFRARQPCFWFGRTAALLPAFGDFTGGHIARPQLGDRVFAVDETTVLEVTALLTKPEAGKPGPHLH